MSERETSRDIDQTASDWTARLDRGPLGAEEEEEAFQSWLEGDPRSRGAFLRAQALWMKSESARALGRGFDPEAFAPTQPAPPSVSMSLPESSADDVRTLSLSRRQAFLWAGGGVAGASLLVLGIALPAYGTEIRTRRGEIRLVPLDDGSTVMLNTQTRIRVLYKPERRQVSLIEGEAYFSVAQDDRRPFVVEVGNRWLRAGRAAFSVSRLDARPTGILVQQGEVVVGAGAETAPSSSSTLTLSPNSRVALSDENGVVAGKEEPQPVSPDALNRELAWREGKISFQGETLEQAARNFARYSDVRIFIRDPALAQEPITGLFAANDPVGFARVVAGIFGADVERTENAVILTRAGRG